MENPVLKNIQISVGRLRALPDLRLFLNLSKGITTRFVIWMTVPLKQYYLERYNLDKVIT